MTSTFLVGGLYRHYKGNRYWVLGLAQHTETDELLVAYVPLYDYGLPGPRLRVRPLAMFIEPVVWPDGLRRPRFLYEGDLYNQQEEPIQ